MCGVNKGQFRYSVRQVDDTLALAQEWLEELHKLADNGGMSDASLELAQVTVLLGEARAKLERAAGGETAANAGDGVTIEAV